MTKRNVINFKAQAEQMLQIVETRLQMGQRGAAIDFLVLKFKALYEQGVASGQLYEREGVYPYTSMDPDGK